MLASSNILGMMGIWIIPVIASILIVSVFASAQPVYAESRTIIAEGTVTLSALGPPDWVSFGIAVGDPITLLYQYDTLQSPDNSFGSGHGFLIDSPSIEIGPITFRSSVSNSISIHNSSPSDFYLVNGFRLSPPVLVEDGSGDETVYSFFFAMDDFDRTFFASLGDTASLPDPSVFFDASESRTFVITSEFGDTFLAGTITSVITISTPAEATQNLIDDIQDLVDSDALNGGQGNSLTSKLENIIAKLDKGKTKPACNQLGAFVNQVQSFIDDGILSTSEGKPLLNKANLLGKGLC